VFHRGELDLLVDLGAAGCAQLATAQALALGLPATALTGAPSVVAAHAPRES
jgi:hypothetical protein